MMLVEVGKRRSPERPSFSRLEATIWLDNQRTHKHYWVECPDSYQHSLSDSANPWLILMSALAPGYGEDIHSDIPADEDLLRNIRCLHRQWKAWHKGLHVPTIEMPTNTSPEKPAESALFYSGGVDSVFSLLRLREKQIPLHRLITVCGFDIKLSNQAEFDMQLSETKRVAAGTGLHCIPVITNLRENDDAPFLQSWGSLTHGSAISFIGMCFEKLFANVFFGSAYSYGNLRPWGSHPLTDPLHSSSNVRVVHHGATFTRLEKTAAICRHDNALRHLRVCWQHDKMDGILNCSHCEKCLRTMAAIDLLGKQDKAISFDWSNYDPRMLASVLLSDAANLGEYREILREAEQRNRMDLAEPLRRRLTLSENLLFVPSLRSHICTNFPRSAAVLRTIKRTVRKTGKPNSTPKPPAQRLQSGM